MFSVFRVYESNLDARMLWALLALMWQDKEVADVLCAPRQLLDVLHFWYTTLGVLERFPLTLLYLYLSV
jgi:hypothetical protein